MQMYNEHSVNLADHFEEEIMGQCKELTQKHEEELARRLQKDMEKMKMRNSSAVKVGLLMPANKAAETEIHHEMQWFEEEMRNREALRVHQLEKEAAEAAEMKELEAKEQKLAGLKAQWQKKVEEIHLEEGELERVQKEFDDKLAVELRTRMESASSSSSSTAEVATSRTRMQEEAEKRALKKQLKQCDADSVDEHARVKLLEDIEEKAALERDIVHMQKEVGLMKQKIRGRGKSHVLNMDDERKRKIETHDGQSKVTMTLEELYAPRVAPPKPVIPTAHQSRMEEARLLKEARRAAAAAATEAASKEGAANC